MNLLIVATQKDLSVNRVIEEAEKKKIKVMKIPYGGDLRPEKLKKFDFCMIRDAYCIGKDFPDFLKTVLTFFKNQRLFDHEMHEKYPPYGGKQLQHPQDKLFQHLIYGKAVKMPRFWHYTTVEDVDIRSFPVIVKKRVGERGRQVFILKTKKEIEEFFRSRSINDYFFEEFLDIKKDIRVFVLNHKAIGAVRRRIRFKDNQGYKGVGVKVVEKYKPSKEIKEKAVTVSKILGSEFCGLDFAIDKDNKSSLLECNVSPWFISSERILEMNIAEKLVDFICEKQNNKL